MIKVEIPYTVSKQKDQASKINKFIFEKNRKKKDDFGRSKKKTERKKEREISVDQGVFEGNLKFKVSKSNHMILIPYIRIMLFFSHTLDLTLQTC